MSDHDHQITSTTDKIPSASRPPEQRINDLPLCDTSGVEATGGMPSHEAVAADTRDSDVLLIRGIRLDRQNERTWTHIVDGARITLLGLSVGGYVISAEVACSSDACGAQTAGDEMLPRLPALLRVAADALEQRVGMARREQPDNDLRFERTGDELQ